MSDFFKSASILSVDSGKINEYDMRTLGVDEKRNYNFFHVKVKDSRSTFLGGREM